MLDGVRGARSRQLVYVVAKAALAVHVRHVDPVEHPFPARATPPVAREHQPWSPSQVATFLEAIRVDRLEALYILALGTGLRRSEVLGLRWADVSDDALIVRGKLDEHSRMVQAPKTARSRRSVDLASVVVDALEAHRSRMRAERRTVSGTAFVFVNEAGQPIVASNLRRAWRTLRARLDLPPIRFYDLRHAHATALAVAGVHPAAVSARLGHASTRLTLDTYSHVMPAMSDAAVPASAALFEKPVPPKTRPKSLGKTRRNTP